MCHTKAFSEIKKFINAPSNFKELKEVFDFATKSCSESKFNFFLQMVSFSILTIIFWIILPEKFDFVSNLGRWLGPFLGEFVLWSLSQFDISRRMLFATPLLLTFKILIGILLALFIILNFSILIDFLKRFWGKGVKFMQSYVFN